MSIIVPILLQINENTNLLSGQKQTQVNTNSSLRMKEELGSSSVPLGQTSTTRHCSEDTTFCGTARDSQSRRGRQCPMKRVTILLYLCNKGLNCNYGYIRRSSKRFKGSHNSAILTRRSQHPTSSDRPSVVRALQKFQGTDVKEETKRKRSRVSIPDSDVTRFSWTLRPSGCDDYT